jgi:hypothetical protein
VRAAAIRTSRNSVLLQSLRQTPFGGIMAVAMKFITITIASAVFLG